MPDYAFAAYDNRLTGLGTWTDLGASFASSPPLANLGRPEVPSPNAEFTGATAEFQFAALDAADAAESFTIRLLALIAMDIDDGATITWKTGAGTTIATQTWNRYKNRPANSYILLDADQSLDTIRCAISGAGTGTHRIGAAYAGPAKVYNQEGGSRYRGQSDAGITRIGGTDWTRAGVRRRGVPMAVTDSHGEVLGVNADGTAFSGTDWETIFETVGLHGPMIACPFGRTQSAIDALTIYGSLDSVGDPENAGGDLWRVEFSVVESR